MHVSKAGLPVLLPRAFVKQWGGMRVGEGRRGGGGGETGALAGTEQCFGDVDLC